MIEGSRRRLTGPMPSGPEGTRSSERLPLCSAGERKETARSSAVPKTPSTPARVSVMPEALSFAGSSGLSKVTTIEGASGTDEPLAGMVVATAGARVSRTTFREMELERLTLPPVSVARTWTVIVLAPAPKAGARAESSHGNNWRVATTRPLTSTSTPRTWESSVTSRRSGTAERSKTCMPGVTGSASAAVVEIVAAGGIPLVSSGRYLRTSSPPARSAT